MLGDALDFVRESDDAIPTVLIGGVLSLLGMFVLPALVVYGYLVRVLRDAAEGTATAPSFTRWGELLVDGVKLLVVGVAYALFVAVPVAVLGAVIGMGLAPGNGDLVAGLAGGLLFLFAVLLALLVSYVFPAAMTNFAVEGRFGAAFDFGTIRRAAFTGDYAVAWLLGLVVSVVGGLVGSALSVLLVGIFLLFVVQVMSFYIWARGFAAGLGRGRPEYAAA